MTLDQIRTELTAMEDTIVAIKACGGYRFRELIRVTDGELEAWYRAAHERLRLLVVKVCVAQQMLKDANLEEEYAVVVESTLLSLRKGG